MKKLIYILSALIITVTLVHFGSPKLLNSFGLHQHYDIPAYDLGGKRALIITTSQATLDDLTTGETGVATGVFGSEMTVPYYAFLDANMKVDIASIKGGKIPVEPKSMGWPIGTEADYRFKEDTIAMAKINHSIAIENVDVDQYDVVFIAGGWGAAYDLSTSDELANLVTKANDNNAILGAVCHGLLGFVNAKNNHGENLIAGRKVTGVTDKQIKELDIELTPFHPETELRKRGALFEANSAFKDFFASHVVVDGNLVTGQNQNSGAETSHQILALLNKAK